MSKAKEFKSARVDAVKAYAVEHYNEDGWDMVVEGWSDLEIYQVIKHQTSAQGAIRKMAKQIGARAEYRTEVLSMSLGDLSASTELQFSICPDCGGKDFEGIGGEHVCTVPIPEIDPAAPNGYFKNGKPKPVSKERRAELAAMGIVVTLPERTEVPLTVQQVG